MRHAFAAEHWSDTHFLRLAAGAQDARNIDGEVRIMLTLRAVERELTGATLVAGVGDPRENAFCLMSLVAHLAGEPHSDRPDAASPLIRDFAVVINDALPHARRQRLTGCGNSLLQPSHTNNPNWTDRDVHNTAVPESYAA